MVFNKVILSLFIEKNLFKFVNSNIVLYSAHKCVCAFGAQVDGGADRGAGGAGHAACGAAPAAAPHPPAPQRHGVCGAGRGAPAAQPEAGCGLPVLHLAGHAAAPPRVGGPCHAQAHHGKGQWQVWHLST